MRLVGGDPDAIVPDGPAVPGGLAIKLFPCCYALQRPISAVLELGPVDASAVRGVAVRTPRSSLSPLIHSRPRTGLEGKFSLEYGIAAALLDGPPGIKSFTDAAVTRAEAQRLSGLVEVQAGVEGDGLLAGEVQIDVSLDGRQPLSTQLALPPGAPERPPSDAELETKLRACVGDRASVLRELSWEAAPDYLRREITVRSRSAQAPAEEER